jgi:NADP-dependent 3-hydroxy acid dehydrogenase YdfG
MLSNLKNSSKRICGRCYCSLSSKTVLITGASSGIGEATARILASLGMNVVLAARRQKELDRIVKEIKEKGGNAVGIPTDITKEEDQKKAFQGNY